MLKVSQKRISVSKSVTVSAFQPSRLALCLSTQGLFLPGPGLGDHCIPIASFYLTWKAREYDHHTRFIELAGEINCNMPKHIIGKLAQTLSCRKKKALHGAKILVAGIAYKKNVDDMRESPSLVLMELLKERGVDFDYYDPYIPIVQPTREHAAFTGMKSVNWSAESIGQYDAVLIATDHDDVDWKLLVESADLIVDTRNALKDFASNYDEKIVKA